VFQRKPASADDAMRLAVEFEAFQTGRKRRLDSKAHGRSLYEAIIPQADDIMRRLAKLEMELPSTYSSVLTTDSRAPCIQRCLNTRHERGIAVAKQSINSEMSDKQNKRSMRCYYCHSRGHTISKCLQYNSLSQQDEDYPGMLS
jgi:hypothetical protein